MWFQAVNLAEKVHRIRRRRDYFLKDSQRPQPGGVEDAIATLKQQGLDGQRCASCSAASRSSRCSRRTRPRRRGALLRKQQRVAQRLLERLDPSLTPHEAQSIWDNIRMELTSGWQTEELPRARLTVADEREQILFYFTDVLYRVVPAFYEEIGLALEKVYGAKGAHRGYRPFCTSAPGPAGTWTATRTCTPRRSAKPSRASSRRSSTPISRTVRSSRSGSRRARAASRPPPSSSSGSSTI